MGRPPRILIFDDDLAHSPDLLEGLDAEFVYRPHADQAVDDVRAVGPDLVLMDFEMGQHRTGAEAVGALREHFPAQTLRIVGISSDPRCNWRMEMAGADETVVKGGLARFLVDLLDALEESTGTEL